MGEHGSIAVDATVSAAEAARKAWARGPQRATGVVRYRSSGTALIIGPAETAAEIAGQLPGDRECALLEPADEVMPIDIGRMAGRLSLKGKVDRLEGYLGRFEVFFETPGGSVSMAEATAGEHKAFDLVLDLLPSPLIGSALKPVGYFSTGGESVAGALTQLKDLVGEFEKPQYFVYDPEICAHSRSGIQACTRCIDVCPADAIRSIGERISVDANLCQGAGACSTVCPTGAIQYAYPRLGDTLDRLRNAVGAYREHGGGAPRIVFAGEEIVSDIAPGLPGGVVPLTLEDPASVGLDVWLSALAYGAAAVSIVVTADTPAAVVSELEAQCSVAAAILVGMNYSRDLVSVLRWDGSSGLALDLGQIPGPGIERVAAYAGLDDKRRVVRLAVDHLYEQASRRRPFVNLPTGAPFGEVWFDGDRCTLCMACVGQCPGKALESGGDRLTLSFVEENCVQCALCARTCPEDAIAPTPRYLFDPEARWRRRVLKQEDPFCCVRCGKPFATRGIIEQMRRKLRQHPMFRDGGLARLEMCDECRVKDMLANAGGNEGNS